MKTDLISWSSFKVVGDEIAYLLEAIHSNWVSGGEFVEKLEASLEKIYIGSRVFSVTNGTAALQLAFQLMGIKPGDEVIVPGFCFQAASNVLIQLGAVPVYCDVDSKTWNQTLQNIKESRNKKSVGIVVVHNYGRATEIEEICDWARDNGLWIIEDCAEAWFTKYKTRFVGQYGDVATFSMHATKTIACGEGGVVMVNDNRLVDRIKLLRSHGLNRNKTHYFHEIPGNNYRLSNLLCAVAFAQVEHHQEILSRQKAKNDAYKNLFQNHWGVEDQKPINAARDNLWAYAVKVHTKFLTLTRDEIIKELRNNGVEARPGFYPASALIYNAEYIKNELSVCESLAKDIIVLPCASNLTENNVATVFSVFDGILNKYRRKNFSFSINELKNLEHPDKCISDFLGNLVEGKKYFRYFNTRHVSVASKHIVCLLIEVNGAKVGYGHIDLCDGVYWVGIAIADSNTGLGLGSLLMSKIIDCAIERRIPQLDLKVDLENQTAIKMYKNNGFYIKNSQACASSCHMVRSILF